MSCRGRITSTCEAEIKAALESGDSPAFEICLPFNGRLYSQGGYVNYEPGTPPPDGVYGKVIIANGCIIGLEKDDLPQYTSSPCAPIPVPCDCGGDGSGTLPEPSVLTGNLFRYDASNKPLVRLSIATGTNLSVSGDGTTDNPLVIGCTSGCSGGSINVTSGNNAISISGSGTSNVTVIHKSNTIGATNVSGMSFDEFGHLVDYTASSASATGVNGVIAGNGLKVDTDVKTGIATVSLAAPLHDAAGTYQLGGYNVSVDSNNHVYTLKQNISTTAGIYRAGNANITLNSYGSVTDITLLALVPAGTYRVGTADITVDAYGIVSDINVLPMTDAHANITKYFAKDSAITMTFSVVRDTAFHIVYTAKYLPTSGITCVVDGVNISGGLITDSRYEWLTTAFYAAGSHTVTINGVVSTSSDGSITYSPAGFLNVALTVAI